jgi:hypothetical protein
VPQSLDAWVGVTPAGRPVARGSASIPDSSIARAGRGTFTSAATVEFVRLDRDFYLRGNDVYTALLGPTAKGFAGRWLRWTAPPEGACSLCQLPMLENLTEFLLDWSPPFTASSDDGHVMDTGGVRVGAIDAVRLQQRRYSGDVWELDVAANGQPQPLLMSAEQKSIGARASMRYGEFDAHFQTAHLQYMPPPNALPMAPGGQS